jgi:beta-galactosidase
VEFYQQPSPGRALVRLMWTTPEAARRAAEAADALLAHVSESGATAFILDHAEGWARFLDRAGVVRYDGRLQGGLYWLGSNYFVREHPLFAALPVDQAFNWEYQELARYEAERYGLLMEGEQAVAGLVSGHHHAVATAIGVIRHGRGRIVISTLDLARSVQGPPGPADVTRKLVCNFIAAASRPDW